jgi:crossover junction endodeoxyribonuclease RusA
VTRLATRVGTTWTLELPFETPLSLNDRAPWPVRQKQVRAWRDAAHRLARAHRIPPCERVRIQLCYVPRDDRRRDPLNLVASLKAVEDGIVDAGVIPDDNSAHHESVMPVITAKGPPRPGRNRLWVTVTRLR